MTRGAATIDRIRKHHVLDPAAKVGIVASTKTPATVDEKNRDIIAIATTDDLDLDEEIVVPGGADLSYWNRNRNVFVDHWYDFASHVGVMRSTIPYPSKQAQRGWQVRIHMHAGLRSPMADDVLTVARESGLGVSIGFEALQVGPPTDQDPPHYRKASNVIRSWRWIELSFTALPCNVACQTQRESEDDKALGALDALVTKGRIRIESARALGLPERKAAPPPQAKRRVVLTGWRGAA